jgi:hypothetical protein
MFRRNIATIFRVDYRNKYNSRQPQLLESHSLEDSSIILKRCRVIYEIRHSQGCQHLKYKNFVSWRLKLMLQSPGIWQLIEWRTGINVSEENTACIHTTARNVVRNLDAHSPYYCPIIASLARWGMCWRHASVTEREVWFCSEYWRHHIEKNGSPQYTSLFELALLITILHIG